MDELLTQWTTLTAAADAQDTFLLVDLPVTFRSGDKIKVPATGEVMTVEKAVHNGIGVSRGADAQALPPFTYLLNLTILNVADELAGRASGGPGVERDGRRG